MTSKPPFDPSKPFETDKPAFDPGQPFEAMQSAEPAASSWDNASLYSKVMDHNWLTHEPVAPVPPERAPIEPSIGKTLAYPGGVVSTAVVQGAKALGGNGSADDMTEALKGNAKSVPQQLLESDFSPAAAYGVGIPLQVATDPFAEFSAAPVKAAAGPVAQYIGNKAVAGAEKFATTPVFNRIANATNVVGKGKDLVGKLVDAAKGSLPDSVKPAVDVASGLAGRAAAYKTPLAPVQAVSDAARGVTTVQKGVAKVLDKLSPGAKPVNQNSKAIKALMSSNLFSEPQLARLTNSPYIEKLERAAEDGSADSVATTHYVLQQTDPGYQKLLKEEQD